MAQSRTGRLSFYAKCRPLGLARLRVSTQLHQQVAGFDELIDRSNPDFAGSGLKASSIIRLGYLAVLPVSNLLGVIGSISQERQRRLLDRLSKHLQK
jgi:mRNA interferase MazF